MTLSPSQARAVAFWEGEHSKATKQANDAREEAAEALLHDRRNDARNANARARRAEKKAAQLQRQVEELRAFFAKHNEKAG